MGEFLVPQPRADTRRASTSVDGAPRSILKVSDVEWIEDAPPRFLTVAEVGTPMWSAPELLAGSTVYGKPIDVYSFAIIMYESHPHTLERVASPAFTRLLHVCCAPVSLTLRPWCGDTDPNTQKARPLNHECSRS